MFKQLLIRKNVDEAILDLAAYNLDKCKDFLKTECEYRLELKNKFLWLNVLEKRIDEAINHIDKPDFTKLAKEFDKGN